MLNHRLHALDLGSLDQIRFNFSGEAFLNEKDRLGTGMKWGRHGVGRRHGNIGLVLDIFFLMVELKG